MSEIRTTLPKDVSQALAYVRKCQSGKVVLDLAKLSKATEILANSDIEVSWFKIRPYLKDTVKEALLISMKFLRDMEVPNFRSMIGDLLVLNRKLSHYAQDESWTEEMHIAAMFYCCKPYAFFNRNFLNACLKKPVFKNVSKEYIERFIFEAPEQELLIFEKGNSVERWKENFLLFIKQLSGAPVPVILIFLAMDLEALRSLHKGLHRVGEAAWEASELPIAEQLWYYDRLAEYLKFGTAGQKLDPNVGRMLDEIKNFLADISKKVKRKNSTSNELVHAG